MGAKMQENSRMVRRKFLAVSLGAGVMTCLPGYVQAFAQSGEGSKSTELYPDVTAQNNEMVAMRDGVKLATDIYRPSREGAATEEKLPVLLHRTPYDKSAKATIAIAQTLARHGYVVVVQDTRGRHHSEGVFEKYYVFDAYDGFDTIEWTAKLPYSNGKVGMFGTSYAAHTQADASKMNPPHLSTMVLNMGGMSNAWNHSVRNDGAFEMGRQYTWAWEQALADTKNPVARAMLKKEGEFDWYTALPLRKGLSPLSIEPVYEGYYLDEAIKSDYGPYWETLGMQWEKYYTQTADVPMLHIGGWYDIYLRGTIENFHKLTELKKSPETHDDRSMDTPRRHARTCGRCELRARRRHHRLRHGLSSTLVRLLFEGHQDTGRNTGSGAVLPYGHRRRAQR